MISAPSAHAHQQARERLAALAIPAGALGGLGELAIWWAGVRGDAAAAPAENIRSVVFAGDHGISSRGVSAYPAEVTPAMVRALAVGVAGVSVLARQHQVSLRVLDISVDAEFPDLDPAISAHKVRRSSGAIDVEDALTAEEVTQALAVGSAIAREEIAAGADLLLGGDLGIGNTTIAAALIAAHLDCGAELITGRGTGVDDDGLKTKIDTINRALDRAGERNRDPRERLAAIGSADIAAQVGFLLTAAEQGVPMLLDGVIAVAAATVAADMEPGAVAWFAAGHRSPEPGQHLALESLGLVPLLDLGMRLGEGSGAMAAIPLVRSATLLLTEVARLDELLG